MSDALEKALDAWREHAHPEVYENPSAAFEAGWDAAIRAGVGAFNMGHSIAYLISAGHTVSITPQFMAQGQPLPVAFRVNVDTLGFMGSVPLDGLPDLFAMAVTQSQTS